MFLKVSCQLCALIILVVGSFACASAGNSGQTGSGSLSIPPTSQFSKISKGMSDSKVHDLIGMPSDIAVRSSGKSWNPLYFGSDYTRTIEYYKGEGRIVYGGNDLVLRVDYDPTEDGYRGK